MSQVNKSPKQQNLKKGINIKIKIQQQLKKKKRNFSKELQFFFYKH